MANEPRKPQIVPLAKIHDLPGVFIPKVQDKAYGGLVTSIQVSGVKEAVILRLREDGEYQLVDGYRRRRASELAKKKDIPALVYKMTLQEAIEYHKKVKGQPTLPVPGVLVNTPTETQEPLKGDKAPETEKKPEQTVPAAPGKKADEPAPKAEQPAPKEGKTPEAEKKPEQATPAVPGKKADEPAPKAEQTAPKEGKTLEAEKKPETVVKAVGMAAKGPAGTQITQVFEDRLSPPDDKELKNLPTPKEGESYFIVLHPGYLEKSKFNTVSVDQNSEDYRELKKSIELNGVKDPVLTRINPDGGLEILSGQRRHMIARELNYPVPAIIQKIDDADAKILVSDGNLHRPKISTYDLSRTLRMKMEGMKQKAGRRKKGFTAEELNSDEKLAKEMGMSVSKLNRIIRLSEASKEVCNRVDDGTLPLSAASALSFLKPENQDVALHLTDLGYKLPTERIEYLKKVEKAGKLDEMTMRKVLDGENVLEPPKVVSFPGTETPQPTKAAPPSNVPTHEIIPPAPTPGPEPSKEKTPVEPAGVSVAPEPVATTPTTTPPAAPTPTTTPTPPEKPAQEKDPFKGEQERPEYTKVILAGDRLRRYFPDVNMTPRQIEESVYEALEERRQRLEKQKQKEAILKKGGPTR